MQLTHLSNDDTGSVAVHGDIVLRQLKRCSTYVRYHSTGVILDKYVQRHCVSPRTANLLAEYAEIPPQPSHRMSITLVVSYAMAFYLSSLPRTKHLDKI